MEASALDGRSREILHQAVHIFITTGEPVGSRTLSKVNERGFSAATIRNVMSDLEEAGFLYQPHTSAGRVPTDRGYRFYVSTLMEGVVLEPPDLQWIRDQMLPNEAGLGGPGGLVQRTTRLLATMTGMVGFVTGPDTHHSVLRHVDFVRMAPRRLLVVLVSQAGHVTNRVVEISEELKGEDLVQYARYLEEQFRGYTLSEAREILMTRLQELEAVVNDLVRNALTIADAAFSEELTSEVHVEGTSSVLSEPEFVKNIERAQHLLATLEQRHRLVGILNACLEGPEVRIVIGSEAPVPDLEGISLIGARYNNGSQDLGSIGIMGPTRMEYARHISVVDYIASSLSAAIAQVGQEQTN
ncbi:MAG: heat-inducible transcriptional repressor HrcA [Acidobacteriota bacterium]|nr:MAG: heat-inducible transcriptional repressor HrcA [Acidobacteriota bacterium]